jgi:hypothetical protein
MYKIVYLFDEITGEFLGDYSAQESPLEPGVYIAPELSTDIAPLPFKEGFAVCFKNGQWEYVQETRGDWFNAAGELINITQLNALVAPDLTRLPPPPTIAKLKALKMQEINEKFEQSIQQITAGYPASETSSWGKQEAEARAYVANSSATTPLIDALASSRSVNKAELVTRIIAKSDLFAGISGTLIGRRQALEDDLNALPETATAEDVAAIVW